MCLEALSSSCGQRTYLSLKMAMVHSSIHVMWVQHVAIPGLNRNGGMHACAALSVSGRVPSNVGRT
eukprot:scaffold108444_cov27-Tisochrysis_lutea.AAC.3